ncbi:MAG: transposase [Acetobacteraceae bacterium]
MERLLAPLRAPTGRPGYPPLALFRALLLAQWYQLSDPGLGGPEPQLDDPVEPQPRQAADMGLDPHGAVDHCFLQIKVRLEPHRIELEADAATWSGRVLLEHVRNRRRGIGHMRIPEEKLLRAIHHFGQGDREMQYGPACLEAARLEVHRCVVAGSEPGLYRLAELLQSLHALGL